MLMDLGKVKELFLVAVELPTEERSAFLNSACGADVELRDHVERLLRSHENAGELLPRSPEEMVRDDYITGAPPPHPQPLSPGAARGVTDDPAATLGESRDLPFLTPSKNPEVLGQLGPYEVQSILGRGGFGVVLKAFDRRLHRVVAIKVLAPTFAEVGSARNRFIREARAAAAVKNEHVVAIYDVQENVEPTYLVMEYIDGISLQHKIDKKGSLELKEILRIGMQIAEGLAAAHKQGLVHRDIKPANILLENGVERVKITDFGLARAVDDAKLTQSGIVAGTPLYMSPEQAEGSQIDRRSDLFSLGTVLYAMCTGHPPFRAKSTIAVLKRVVEDTPRPIREINRDVPQWLCDVITKLHAKNPHERFASAKEVAELLERRLAGLQESANGIRKVQVDSAPSSNSKRLAKVPPHRKLQWTSLGLAMFAAGCCVLAIGLWVSETTGYTNVRGTVLGLFSPGDKLDGKNGDAGAMVGNDKSKDDPGAKKDESKKSTNLDTPADDLIASTGFNAVHGMNGKLLTGPPFVLDMPNREGGIGEPGWAGPWPAHQDAVFQSKVVREGDGALYLKGRPNVGPNYARQFAKPQTGRFQVEYHVQVPTGSSFAGYVWQHPRGADFSGPNWGVRDGHIDAAAKHTGFKCVPGQWHKLTLHIDVSAQTWEFFVDGNRYDSPQPLRFRGDVAYLDAVNFVVEGGVYIDQLRVTRLPDEKNR